MDTRSLKKDQIVRMWYHGNWDGRSAHNITLPAKINNRPTEFVVDSCDDDRVSFLDKNDNMIMSARHWGFNELQKNGLHISNVIQQFNNNNSVFDTRILKVGDHITMGYVGTEISDFPTICWGQKGSFVVTVVGKRGVALEYNGCPWVATHERLNILQQHHCLFIEKVTLNKWTKRYLDLAEHISSWSYDPSTKVGAVIVDQKKRVVSVGYNGFPRNVEDSIERYTDRNTKIKLVCHAEQNALDNSPHSIEGCVLYSTLCPCNSCAKSIIQRGINEIHTYELRTFENNEDPFNWEFSKLMFKEAGIKLNFYPSPRLTSYNK